MLYVETKFKKVKNEYHFILSDGTYYYFDINTCKWYYYNHQNELEQIEDVPRIWSWDYIGGDLLGILTHYDTFNNIPIIKMFDKVASLFINYNVRDSIMPSLLKFCITDNNFKFLSKFLKDDINFGEEENEEDNFTTRFKAYVCTKKYSSFMGYLNNKAINYVEFWSAVQYGSNRLDLSIENFMEKYGLNFIHYCNKRIFLLIDKHDFFLYYRYCEEFNIPIKKGDFIKNFSEVYILHKEKERKEKNEKIKKIQTKKPFAFENENFKVEIPTTLEEFIRLGKEFNNCLGGWEIDSRVLEDESAVAILRAKDNSWKIACDFNCDDFTIDQFYKPNNEEVEEEDTEILKAKEIYQTYLYSFRLGD